MAIWDDLFTSGGGLPVLAPDLSFPDDKAGSTVTRKQITGINAVGALTTAVSLIGKFVISHIDFLNLTTESMTIKLTIDGFVIWDSTFVVGSSEILFGATSVVAIPEFMQCNTSFLLEIQTTSDTDVRLEYLARPIL